jgi:hypothetical protein
MGGADEVTVAEPLLGASKDGVRVFQRTIAAAPTTVTSTASGSV